MDITTVGAKTVAFRSLWQINQTTEDGVCMLPLFCYPFLLSKSIAEMKTVPYKF